MVTQLLRGRIRARLLESFELICQLNHRDLKTEFYVFDGVIQRMHNSGIASGITYDSARLFMWHSCTTVIPTQACRGSELSRGFTTSGNQNSRGGEEAWPTSLTQKKFAHRVEEALEWILGGGNDELSDSLVREGSMAVVEVRMAPDLLTAYILWDAPPEKVQRVERELRHRTIQIRQALGRILKTRNLIRVEFRHNTLTEEQQRVVEEFRRLGVDVGPLDTV